MSVIPDTWELRKENYRSQASLGNLGTLSLGLSLLGYPYNRNFKKKITFILCLCVMQTTHRGMYVEVRRQPVCPPCGSWGSNSSS